jgi:four helix bundle protein
MRRAAVSIISNIAEGAARGSDKELIQFLYHSLGSAAELETQIIIARELGYISDSTDMDATIQQIKQMLIGLIKYLKSKSRT